MALINKLVPYTSLLHLSSTVEIVEFMIFNVNLRYGLMLWCELVVSRFCSDCRILTLGGYDESQKTSEELSQVSSLAGGLY